MSQAFDTVDGKDEDKVDHKLLKAAVAGPDNMSLLGASRPEKWVEDYLALFDTGCHWMLRRRDLRTREKKIENNKVNGRMERTLFNLRKSIRVDDRFVHYIIESKMPSKVGGSGVKASKELIFVEGCIGSIEPGMPAVFQT